VAVHSPDGSLGAGVRPVRYEGEMATDLTALRELAATQDGQFSIWQARALHISAAAVGRCARRGEAERLGFGVLRFTAAPGEARADVTAMLTCGPLAVISHASAAQRHGLRRISAPDRPIVTMPHAVRRRTPDLDVRYTRAMPDADVLLVGAPRPHVSRLPARHLLRGGVRITSLARTVCDLFDPGDVWESLALLDDAVAAGASHSWVHARASTLLAGRPNLQQLVLATAPGAAAVFRSWLERVSSHVYRAGGLPDPEFNVEMHDEQGLIGVVDALWRPWRVVGTGRCSRSRSTCRAPCRRR
jgi:hypothetical protein